MESRKPRKINSKWWLIAANLLGLLPLGVLVWAFWGNQLGFNPVETALQRTGQIAVSFLLLSLAFTPLRRLFKWPILLKFRKIFGLYASLYAFTHFATFAIWDYGLNLPLIWMEIQEKPFILLGFAALIILLVLAATSFRYWQKKLGKGWRSLHRLVYLAAVLVLVHYFLAVKGDIFSLQGDYGAPLVAGIILILLFLLRFPFIYRPLQRLINRKGA
jgi:sulfoxide reductase heme-binding subunit YedZ